MFSGCYKHIYCDETYASDSENIMYDNEKETIQYHYLWYVFVGKKIVDLYIQMNYIKQAYQWYHQHLVKNVYLKWEYQNINKYKNVFIIYSPIG